MTLPRGIEPRSPALIGTKEDKLAELLLGHLVLDKENLALLFYNGSCSHRFLIGIFPVNTPPCPMGEAALDGTYMVFGDVEMDDGL
ncbi:hypothetical protein N7510_004536 [Penicillium lagena]|uniref:uncharacterized protein n=1 Tax=Penicillium lagena TaxID=94218 RepID=UPI0025421318|nr:uncharacterized protein N7510_004536 [Penicillium lagena]KAJ5620552.1 hypothetical protein N7510_004536 [Penicillium lagena]